MTCYLFPECLKREVAGIQHMDLDVLEIPAIWSRVLRWEDEVVFGPNNQCRRRSNILFAPALDGRSKADGVRAFSLHPGTIITPLSKHVPREALRAAGIVDEEGRPIIDPAKNLKIVEQGAATSIWCATSPQLEGMDGVYCQNSDIAPLVIGDLAANQFGSLALGVMPHAVDPQLAERLWGLSEELLDHHRRISRGHRDPQEVAIGNRGEI